MTRREMDKARDWFRNYADCLETELEMREPHAISTIETSTIRGCRTAARILNDATASDEDE